MEKSRLGISINLFAALIYFVCVANNILVGVVIAGYVLLFEESDRLKRTAVKALIITIFLAVAMPLTNYLFALSLSICNISQIVRNYNNSYSNSYIFLNISNYIQMGITYIIYFAQIIIPVIFGFKAYKEKDIKIKVIDKILDKHF